MRHPPGNHAGEPPGGRDEVALPDRRATPGSHGACVLHRLERETAHFLMLTRWEPYAAIHAFASDDIGAASTPVSTTMT